MTEKERLMITAMEECAEIQQEISKALRFGINNQHPNEPGISNGERIMKKFFHLIAVIDTLNSKGYIPYLSRDEESDIYKNKLKSIEKWEAYSKSIDSVS